MKLTIEKLCWAFLLFCGSAVVAPAQQTTALSYSVPRLIRYSGMATDPQGKHPSGTMGATFALYKDEHGGAALWIETQNVTADASGRYTVQLGASKPDGLPAELFTSGEARWLGVSINGQAEQSRVLLLSVPYALKAADAETIGGLPPSAFVLAAPPNSNSSTTPSSGSNSNENPPSIGGTGKTNYLPASTLDVNGGSTIRGLFSLPASGTATATIGFNSQPMDLAASVFNSGTSTAVPQTFQWQAEPVGNNTTKATGSLNLLFAQGTGKPTETGLNIASNGQIKFASGQTFPGTGTITGVTAGSGLTGGGTSGNINLSVPINGITNSMLQNSSLTVSPGIALTGGGAVSLGGGTTLSVDTTKVVTGVIAGTDLTGGGTGGVQTLSLDTTKVPQLNANNTFYGNQTVNGNLTVMNNSSYQPFLVQSSNTFGTWLELSNTSAGGQTWNILSAGSSNSEGAGNLGITNLHGGTIWLEGPVNATQNITSTGIVSGGVVNAATSFDLGGNVFAFGSPSGSNAFLGFAGNSTTTGTGNTASGVQALVANTTGTGNTAIGNLALAQNTNGGFNTGVGYLAGGGATSAFGGTAIGAFTTISSEYATAIGAYAEADEAFTLVLGGINGVNGANADTFVGIGTTLPATLLHINHAPLSGGRDVLEITSGGSKDVASLLLQNTASGGLRLRHGVGTSTAYLASSGPLEFVTADTGTPSNPSPPAMTIDNSGNVNIKGT
jgi:hypothetical protein